MNDPIELTKLELRRLNLRDDEVNFFIRVQRDYPDQLLNCMSIHKIDDATQQKVCNILSK
jgi:hypothetical protein